MVCTVCMVCSLRFIMTHLKPCVLWFPFFYSKFVLSVPSFPQKNDCDELLYISKTRSVCSDILHISNHDMLYFKTMNQHEITDIVQLKFFFFT